MGASQTVKTFKSDEKTKHHKNLLDHLTRSKTFSRKNPVFSKPVQSERKNQNPENQFFLIFSRILIYSEDVLEAALDNYSLYRCSTLSSTAEESITRRLTRG